jgi:hypothetical protein
MVMIGVGNGFAHLIQEVLRGNYIRISETQVDDVPPLFAHLRQLHVHLGAEIPFKQIQSFRNLHFPLLRTNA